MQNILLIDRDGTLVEEPEDEQVDELSKIRLMPGVIPALLALIKGGFRLVMVSNQDGLGTPDFPKDAFQSSHDFILALFASQGIRFDEILICPHRADEHCSCRKPKTGLLDVFLRQRTMNVQRSWVIGDRDSDRLFAEALDLGYLPISKHHGWELVSQIILNQIRSASVHRCTQETSIQLKIRLDTHQASTIHTPIDFFSHLLEQVARHGGFQMELDAAGDVNVDDHHLIEDTAIVFGEALRKALGDKWGIGRYGFTLPMDESLASLAIDLSGRPFCVFEGHFTRESVGGMATEMVSHFFQSLSTSLRAAIHVKIEGKNHHHMIEACFKALGRALKQAITQTCDALPSTKGVL